MDKVELSSPPEVDRSTILSFASLNLGGVSKNSDKQIYAHNNLPKPSMVATWANPSKI
jgi:hypothetical protein